MVVVAGVTDTDLLKVDKLRVGLKSQKTNGQRLLDYVRWVYRERNINIVLVLRICPCLYSTVGKLSWSLRRGMLNRLASRSQSRPVR